MYSCKCIDCGKDIPKEIETDIRLCQDCMTKYNVDLLWEMHDRGKLNALDFNENYKMRERFRTRR